MNAARLIKKWRARHRHVFYPVAHTGGGELCQCGKAKLPDGWGIDWKR